jgi:glycosyltransferase involved in cell wall biosynthesis
MADSDTGDLQHRRAEAALRRARRDSERARRALARALAAEARLLVMEQSFLWRLLAPVRHVFHALPALVRQLLRRVPAHSTGKSTVSGPVPMPQSGSSPLPVALLIDDNWPRPDCDAGSIEIVNLAEALLSFGFEVRFAADREHGAGLLPGSGRVALAARGIRCLGSAEVASVEAYLEREGSEIALIILNRVWCGGRFMDQARLHCPKARIIFNTIDLHYVRIRREAELSGDQAGLLAAQRTQEREQALASEADATLVVSKVDRDLLAALAPLANIEVLPLAREVRPPSTPFTRRRGIGFIGGFAHSPNLDAIDFFFRDLWQLVLRRIPNCEFSIVGEGLPTSLLVGQPGKVCYLGHVPDVTPWFESLRLTVAPIRFGSGMKGKVISSLVAGVPCVVTSMAAEGMGLSNGDGILIADKPDHMAELIASVHGDAALWAKLSAAALVQSQARFSPSVWRRNLAEALWTIDALPGAATTREFIKS